MAAQPSNGQQHGPGITRIAVTGFKSLATKTDVEIRPLTVLAGANSSGKSSLMQPLLLMKQTLESSVVPAGPFLLSGPYTRYTETKQFLTSGMGTASNPPRFSVDFTIDGDLDVGYTYAVKPNTEFDLIQMRIKDSKDQMGWMIDENVKDDYRNNFIRQKTSGSIGGPVSLSLVRHKYFYRTCVIRLSSDSSFDRQILDIGATLDLNNRIRRILYVPGLRGDQLRKWLLAEVPATNVYEGPFESYVPSIIEYWQQTNPRISPSINELNAALKLLGLASSVRTLRLNESEVEMRVPRTFNSDESDYVNIADVGLAVSNVLPVLVALIQAAPGQLVYIEQPELHLHPKAQVLMAQLLANAANRGARLVIETHSSLLLQGILTQVAQDKLSDDKVVLHWFEREPQTGFSTVRSAEPDPMGRVGEWPEDFSDVELKSSNDYLDAVESKLYAGKK
jgi:predicted ATPase